MKNEMTLTFNVYNTLAQKLEQDKLRVQEETPVYTVIEPATRTFEKKALLSWSVFRLSPDVSDRRHLFVLSWSVFIPAFCLPRHFIRTKSWFLIRNIDPGGYSFVKDMFS